MRTKVIFTITIAVTVGLILITSNREWFMSSPNAFIYFMTGVIVVVITSAIGYARREGNKETQPALPSEPPADDRRRFTRVQHKLRARPRLTIDGNTHDVHDISEQGIRVANPDGRVFQKWVRGTLTFSDGTELEIDGLIVRKQPDEIGLQLITTIPKEIITREAQFRLATPR